MKKNRILAFSVFCLLGIAQAEDSQIQFKQVSISGQFDNGQVISGTMNQNEVAFPNVDLEGNFFNRTGVWITQDATVNNRLELTVGVGGVFWYALPAAPSSPTQQQTQFGPGISQAQAIYTFGNLDHPAAKLQMGYFPYKYNSDAKNLGEYLLRSGTYPGYLVSGGWNMVSSAGYMVQGLRLNATAWDGKLDFDFILPMEHDLPPLFSVSPTFVAKVKPVAGLEINAGVDCNHCLSVKPSAETPHVESNQVILSASYDSTAGVYNYVRDTTSYYSFEGIKLMASISFDPKAYLPMPMLGSEDLKIYSEWALLGVKNYSYMYDDKWQRMPVMVGFNIPTFKLLDVLSVEGEYYGSQFTNDLTSLYYKELPQWGIPDFGSNTGPGTDQSAGVTPAQYQQNASDVSRDNWKWSIYGKKQIVKGIDIFAQVASDHFRPISFNLAPFPAMVPVTNRNGKDWYYLVRLQFGI